MSDTPIRTPAEALEAAARVAYFQIMKEPLCSAVGVAAGIRAIAPRIPPAPDDEALVEVMCNAVESVSYDVGGASCGDMETAMRAVLLALREAGALRHEQ